MRKFTVNVILIMVFVLLILAIVLPLVAEVEFEQAKKLEVGYRWRKAGEKYQAAVHLNPFNAKYFAGAGGFLIRQAQCRKNRSSWFKRAEKLYERACQLNPSYAEYRYLLGKTELEIDRNKLEKVTDNFREAIEKDPYNFRNNYLIGYDMFTVWDSLDDAGRSFALERFKYVLQRQPWYADSVYPTVIYFAKDFSLAEEVTPQNLAGYKRLYSSIVQNNLWQYRRRVKKSVDFYRQKEEPEEFEREKKERMRLFWLFRDLAMTGEKVDWAGKSRDGENEYKNGNMYWEGTVNRAIKLPEGKAIIHIQSRGDQAWDIWPYMITELDGEEIGEGFVDSPEWKEYSFVVDTDGGIKVLSVTFLNDEGNEEREEDRNLYVGKVRIEINRN